MAETGGRIRAAQSPIITSARDDFDEEFADGDGDIQPNLVVCCLVGASAKNHHPCRLLAGQVDGANNHAALGRARQFD